MSAKRRTRREAVAALDDLALRLDQMLTADGWTLGGWVEHWLAGHDLAEESIRLYTRMLNTHIRPRLGAVSLGDIDTPTLQLAYDRMLLDGVGTASIGRVHSVLSTALGEAARRGLIRHVPTDHARPPRHRASKPQPLTPAQCRDVLAACRTPGAPSGRIIATILLLGLRASEAIDLRWHHVDADGGWITVPGTKTAGSEAALPLVAPTIDIIGPQGTAEDDWPVFPSNRGPDVPTSRQTVHRHWRELCGALGIPARRIHDLRHSTGSLLASNGVPTRVIQSVLRHSSAAMSVHYSRPHDPALRDALEKLTAGLS